LTNTVLNSGPNPRTVMNSPSRRSGQWKRGDALERLREIRVGQLADILGAMASTIPCESRLMARAV